MNGVARDSRDEVAEQAFYDCALVKNHRAAVIMSPAGNGPGVQGLWISRLGLTRVEHEGKPLSFPESPLQHPGFDSEPGRVTTSYWSRFIGFLRIDQELTATGGESFSLRYRFRNDSAASRSIAVVLEALTEFDMPERSLTGNRFDFRFVPRVQGPKVFSYAEFYLERTPCPVSIVFPERGSCRAFDLARIEEDKQVTQQNGVAWRGELELPPNGEAVLDIRILYDGVDEMPAKRNAVTEHWQRYSRDIPPIAARSLAEERAYRKAWAILFFNEVDRNGHRWVQTGPGFGSLWIWDTSPFVVDAYLDFRPDWAEGMVRAQLESIRPDGFMPLHALMARYHRKEPAKAITQIPLVAASAWKVFSRNQDLGFADAAYETLKRNYRWFETRRKPDPGIPLWIVDDYRKPYFSGAESGMDNSPIYDGKLLYSVAQNTAKQSFEEAMAGLAGALGKTGEQADWRQRRAETLDFMHRRMWSEEDSFYFPLDAELRPVRIKTADVFPGFYFDIFPSGRLDRMARIIEQEFLTSYGVATVSTREPSYEAGNYFRGAVWPCMNYMVSRGLRRHGRGELAERILAGTVLAATEFPSIYECYDPAHRALGHYGYLRSLPHMSFCAAGLIAMLRMRTTPLA